MKSVLLLMVVLATTVHTNATTIPAVYEYTGAGLLLKHKRGQVTLEEAKNVLEAFVYFSADIPPGEIESDQTYLRKYIRTDVPGFPLEKIRDLVLQQLARAAGRESLTEAEAIAVIEGLTHGVISNSWWTQTGYYSVYLLIDGSGKIGWWIPNNRNSETILFYNGAPVFSLFCLNPIISAQGEGAGTPMDPQLPLTPMPVEQPIASGGGNIYITNTNTNTNGGGQQQQPQVVYMEDRRPRFTANLNLGAMFRGNVRTPDYFPPNYGQRSYGGGYRQQYRPRPIRQPHWNPPPTYSSGPRRYNTSQLNPVLGGNQGGSVGRRGNGPNYTPLR